MQYSSSTPSFNNNRNNGGSRNFTHSPENVRSQSYRSTVFYRDEDGTTHQTLSYLNPNPNKEQFFESLKETYAKEQKKFNQNLERDPNAIYKPSQLFKKTHQF